MRNTLRQLLIYAKSLVLVLVLQWIFIMLVGSRTVQTNQTRRQETYQCIPHLRLAGPTCDMLTGSRHDG